MTGINKILLGLALAQLIALGGLSLLGDTNDPASFDPTPLIKMDAGDVVRVTITDDDQEVVELSKSSEGWQVSSSDDYPADESRIVSDDQKNASPPTGAPLIDKLAGLMVERPSIRRPENHAPLRVAANEFERRVMIEDSSGKKETFFVASGARPQTVYVRRDGEDNVFEVSDLSTWDLSTALSNWIDTAYLTLERSEVVGITADFADQPGFRMVRREIKQPEGAEETDPAKTETPKTPVTKWWFTAPTKDEVKPEELNTILAKLTGLRLKDVHGKSAPMDAGPASATWTVTMADGKKVELIVGGKVSKESDDRHVKTDASNYHAIIASWDASTLLKVDLEELRVQPPETLDGEPKEEQKK